MAKANTSKLNITPAPGYLLIEPQEVQTKTSGGIYLAENVNAEKPQKGKVLAVGEKDGKKESPAQKGDEVVYKKWGGNEYKHEGKEYTFIKFEDILAIIK
ncbi:MAG TPA: co-chaperone GroES [Patescibacteria group bacterium]|nr:co-chaperone GroES [Patescibacteria group bacterium]